MKTVFLPLKSRRRRYLFNFMKVVVPLWGNSVYHFEVFGQHHVPLQGPAVILPKHQYWTDIPLIGLAFSHIPLNYVAKKELFRFPLLKGLLTTLGGIPLDRKAPIKTLDTFRHLHLLLKEKHYVVIFPEGTYVRGSLGKGKSRLIKSILKFQRDEQLSQPIPFIPVGIIYQKMRIRKKVVINIGPPLHAQQEVEAEQFTRTIMSSIARLSGLDFKGQHTF